MSSDQRSLVAEHKLLLVKEKDILSVTLLILSDCLLIAKDISNSRMEFLALFDVLHSKIKKTTAEDGKSVYLSNITNYFKVKKKYQVRVPDREFFLEIHHKKRVSSKKSMLSILTWSIIRHIYLPSNLALNKKTSPSSSTTLPK